MNPEDHRALVARRRLGWLLLIGGLLVVVVYWFGLRSGSSPTTLSAVLLMAGLSAVMAGTPLVVAAHFQRKRHRPSPPSEETSERHPKDASSDRAAHHA